MDKPTDIPEQPQVSTSCASEPNKAETLEQLDSATSEIAGENQASTEQTDATLHSDTGKIPTNPPAAGTDLIPRVVREIETEVPTEHSSKPSVSEGNEVNNSGKSSSAAVGSVAEIERAEMRPQLLSRRRLITLGFSLAAGFVAVFWSPMTQRLGSFWQLSALRRKDNPYFRLSKSSAVYAPVGLDEGFYARKPIAGRPAVNTQRRNIIHYVDSKKRVPFVKSIDARTRRPALKTELAVDGFTLTTTKTPRFPATHVSLGHASALFELAALQKLQAKQYGPACELLIDGIRHDLAFKQRVGGAPSVRLLDLLAIVSVRQNQEEHLNTLLRLADEAMQLIDQQSIGRAASRKPRRKQPAKVPLTRPSKKGPQDNPRKRLLPLDAAALEGARARRKAVLQARLKNWKSEAWQTKRKDPQRRVVWSMTPPPDQIERKKERLSVAI